MPNLKKKQFLSSLKEILWPIERSELKLFIPKTKRNLGHETNIKKRLKEHFQRHLKEQKKSIDKIKGAGLLWFFAGAVILTLNGFIFQREEVLLKFLSID
jgi:hypothetical protein